MMAGADQRITEGNWFSEKKIRPMRITTIADAFNSKEYMFELMREGIRCIAYLDENETELRSARNMRLLPLFPELANLHMAAMKPCILDGFIVYDDADDGEPIYNRMHTTLPTVIQEAAMIHPAKMIAYDILYCDGVEMINCTYQARRLILRDNVNDIRSLSISHALEELGVAFFSLAEDNGWDGILAKRKDGLYRPEKSLADWLYIPVIEA